MSFWNKIKHAAESVGDTVEDAAKTTVKVVSDTTKTVWHATSDEANDIASAIESAGTTVSKGVVEGAKFAETWSEKGAVIAYQSAVEAGEYVTQHACDIAVGSALSATFVTLAADGEEEVSMGALAVACAASTLDTALIATESKALAAIISDPIWLIPGISMGGKLSKDNLRAILAFVIQKCCTEKPELVVGSGGQFIAGALIACTTTLICEGALPGGYKV